MKYTSAEPPPVCPECTAGKHDNCHGDAWDNEKDAPAVCECWANNHEGVSE